MAGADPGRRPAPAGAAPPPSRGRRRDAVRCGRPGRRRRAAAARPAPPSPRSRPVPGGGRSRPRRSGPRSRRRCRAGGCPRSRRRRRRGGSRPGCRRPARRGRGPARLQGHDPAAVPEQRRRVPAADDPYDAGVVGHLHQEGGDEAFTGLGVGLGELGQVPLDAELQGGGQRGQGGVVVGGLAERAEEHGGVLHGRQPLAADVADQESRRVVGTGGAEQVPAHQGVRGGRAVDGGDPQRAHALRDRPQQHPLGGLGHRPHLVEFPQVAVVQRARGDDEAGDRQQRADVDGQDGRVQQPVVAVDDQHRGAGDEGDARGEPGAGERGRGRRGGHQQRGQVDGHRGERSGQSDRRDQSGRQGHLDADARPRDAFAGPAAAPWLPPPSAGETCSGWADAASCLRRCRDGGREEVHVGSCGWFVRRARTVRVRYACALRHGGNA